MWDGIVSVLRTYTERELMEMANAADKEGKFNWKFSKQKGSPVTLFAGIPKS